MGDVIDLPVETSVDIPPDKILHAALGELNDVLVIGLKKDGSFYSASSSADLTLANFLASKFIHKIHAEYSEE